MKVELEKCWLKNKNILEVLVCDAIEVITQRGFSVTLTDMRKLDIFSRNNNSNVSEQQFL